MSTAPATTQLGPLGLNMHDEPLVVPTLGQPKLLGVLAGVGAKLEPADTKLFGTDLGISFEHKGQLFMVFGDTWTTAESLCNDGEPHNDDVLGALPLSYTGGMPVMSVFRKSSDPTLPEPIQIFRGSESLKLGWLQVPLTVWSDGPNAFGMFDQMQPLRCDETAQDGQPLCATDDEQVCRPELGTCEPPTFADARVVCDADRKLGCEVGQDCQKRQLCVDPTSAQYDDASLAGLGASALHRIEIGVQRADDPAQFDTVLSWASRKFSQPAARTVQKLTGRLEGNDYRPGHGSLLVWGRPGYIGQEGREAQLYLLRHDLPLDLGDGKKLRFEPRYFAGIDPLTQQPQWTEHQSQAKPIALDGLPGGDPHETVEMVGQMALSWLPEPINKWMMLYGADPVDEIIGDPAARLPLRAAGSIMVRFADHPWGPFSPALPFLQPGDPRQVGDLQGPGGLLYNPDCVSTPEAQCQPRGQVRPADAWGLPGCPPNLLELDPGRLYAPNIIDNYTSPNAHGGLDIVWNVSIWDPYSVVMFTSSVNPPGTPPASSELADARSLQRLGAWRSLPELADPVTHVRQSSRERQAGALDVNNFVCASKDARIDRQKPGSLRFDEPSCAEPYVQGVVLGRFEGPGRLQRSWLSLASARNARVDNEVLRLYVDDDPTPRVDVPLADAISGHAGEMFARPFGAGSTRHLAWYYPVSFQHKLIVALDKLDQSDSYAYELDAVRDPALGGMQLPTARLPERDRALTQLDAYYHPALGSRTRLLDQSVQLAAASTQHVHLDGPATIHELRLRVDPKSLSALSSVNVSVRWEGASDAAITLPLTELFGYDGSAPQSSSLALTSLAERDMQVLTLKLPMPFASSADLSLDNRGQSSVQLQLTIDGETSVPASAYGHLHVQRSETRALANAPEHVAVSASGRGRLVGVCHHVEGSVDTTGTPTPAPRLEIDGQLAAAGTGSDHWVDDAFGFEDGARANAFVQVWDITNAAATTGRASFCRWQVLGQELDFARSLKLSFELQRAGDAAGQNLQRSVAYYYLQD